MAKKSGWGWASTILTVAAFVIGGPAGLALMAASAITGYQESKFQQRQAMRAYKKAFGSIGDNALAGSPTYSWDGPRTVSDVSLPVPLCYGEVTVGGNIVNAWTETVNILPTKWVGSGGYIPKHTTISYGNWETIVRTVGTTARGVRVAIKSGLWIREANNSFPTPTTYDVYWRVTGDTAWIQAKKDSSMGSQSSKLTMPSSVIISEKGRFIGTQFDIKLVMTSRSSIFNAFQNMDYVSYVEIAESNTLNDNEVLGHVDYQNLTIAIAEGEIQGIDEGDVKLNDNPLYNYGVNYYDFDYILGANAQIPNDNFDTLTTENSRNEKLFKDIDTSIFLTQNSDIQSFVVLLYFPNGLYQITDNKLALWQTDITINYRKYGDITWTPVTKIIKIKNNNPFKNAIKIDVSQGQYEIKITKTSNDPDTAITFGDVWWIGIQELVTQAQNYPNTALAFLRLQATDKTSGDVPNLTFKIRGKLVEVPKLTIVGNTVPYHLTYWNGSNYVLDEPWNGNAAGTVCTDANLFVSQWTDNPIWCLRDLINNDYYGLRSYFQSTLNDADLRLLAKYCDEKVDNGQGGTDKRFKLDIVIDSQDDARNVIERILSTFRGFAVWAENQFKIKINKAENPVQLFTMGNIIENSLSINYSSASDRFNVAKITYPDRNDAQARMSEVPIYDVPLGGQERVQTFNLIGITRRSQAVRMGRFFLNQAKYIKESIQFKAGLDSIACEAGDVIEFAHDVVGYGLASGRIKASTINSISIDTPISIDAQKTYKVKVKLTDDTIEERTIAYSGNFNDVSINAISATYVNANGVSLDILRDGLNNNYGGYSATENQWSLGYIFPVNVAISKIRWYNFAASERNKHFYIEYSMDGSTNWTKIPIIGWGENSTMSSTDEAEAGNINGWNTVIFASTIAKGFRITVTTFWAIGDNNAGISEIQMYSLDTSPYTLVTTSDFTSIPPVDSMYAFGESGTVTKPYRVLSINRDSIQERQITAIEDNASIYSDTGDAVEPISYSSLKNPLRIPDSVTNLTLKELTVDPGDGSKINTILVSWNPPTLIDDPSILPIVATATTGGSIVAGTYYCKYTWIGAGGETMTSSVASIVTTGSTSTITITIPSFPTDVTSARVYVGTTSGQEKYQGQITASAGSIVLTTVPLTGNAIPLTNSTQNDTNYDRAKVYISDSAGAFWEYVGEGRSNFIVENIDKLTFKIAVVSLSLYGIAQSISDASKADITIQGKTSNPANVSFSSVVYGSTVIFKWSQIADKDIAFYEIRAENANWGTVNSNLIYQGLGDTFTWQSPTQTSYTFYIKARDTSGNYSTTAGSQAVSNIAPTLGSITVDFTGKDCRLNWTPLYDNDLKEYRVLIYSDSNRTVLLRNEATQDPNYIYTYENNAIDNSGTPIRTIYLTVKAIDLLGQEGVQNTSGTNSAPSAPSGLSASNFMEFVYLAWTAVTDIDLVGYNVYVDTVKVAFVAHPSYGHYGSEGVQYNYYVKAVDSFGEGNQSLTVQGTSQGLNIGPTDINDFAVSASKIFTKIPILESDSWTDNSPSAGYVAWNAHNLYYNGALYSITGNSTNLKYIYWTGGTTYSASNTNPTLTDGQFIIATNVGGAHDLAWNAIANEVIGSAYIQQLAVQDGHIQNLSVGKLTSGTIDAKVITLVRTAASDCAIKAGKSDFGDNATPGFIIGFDYTDADKIKFEIGTSTNYLNWNGSTLDIRGSITITGGSGFANLTDRSADNLLDGTTYKKYAATEQTKLAGVEAGANVTETRTAAAIAGQGALATKSNVDLSTAEVLNKTANYIAYTAGGTVDSLKPAEAGATLGATWGSNIVSQPGWSVDGRVPAGFDSSGNVISSIDAAIAGGITFISGGYINTGLVHASRINVGILDASVVNVINLNANNITAGGTITGNTIQTAASGARFVVSTSDNFAHFYDASGIERAAMGDNSTSEGFTGLRIGGTDANWSSYSKTGAVIRSATTGIFVQSTTTSLYSRISGDGYGIRADTNHNNGLPFRINPYSGWTGTPVGTSGSASLRVGGFAVNASGKAYYHDNTAWRPIAYGISGTVTGAGGITSGTGFNVNRVSAGTYDITFTTAFGAAPIVIVTVGDTGNGTCIRRQAITTGGFRTVTFLGSNQAIGDSDFSFFAIVP